LKFNHGKKGFAKRQRFSKENIEVFQAIEVYHEKTYVLLKGRGLAKNK
jgi:hypothetical protein